MFVLKKILGHLLMPLPLGLGLITLGLLLLLFRRRARGWVLLILGWLVLAVASNRAVSLALTASLEKTYAPVPPFAAPALPSAPAPSADDTRVEATNDVRYVRTDSSGMIRPRVPASNRPADPLHVLFVCQSPSVR